MTRQPPAGHRLFCTVKPNLPSSGSGTGGRHRHATSYTLYVEQLGSLYPILVATRRSSKIRQSFTISVPSSQRLAVGRDCPSLSKDLVANGFVAVPDTLPEHPADMPSNAQTPPREPQVTVHARLTIDVEEEGTTKTMFRGMGVDYHTHGTVKEGGTTLCPAPPSILAEVVSNMMSSKFRVQGYCPQLPGDLGTVSIKTSLLHIQPRKVTVLLPKPDGCDSGIESDLSSESASDDDDVFEDVSATVSPLMPEQTMRKLSSRRLSSAPDPAIILNSKTPTWNEQHMIYQLDFGGRVTTKSAKNFQLELNEKQVREHTDAHTHIGSPGFSAPVGLPPFSAGLLRPT